MQLSPLPAVPAAPEDLPTALATAAQRLGHRPAVTVLGADRREEQSVASLAQWAAKGAHLLELDLLLGPGDRLVLDAPTGWGAATVCLAAWWAGIEVVVPERSGLPVGELDAEVAVVHEDRDPPTGATEVLRLGEALDGAPVGAVAGEAWASAVQAFPDHPPAPRGAGDAAALRAPRPGLADHRWAQAELLDRATQLGAGTYGLEVAADDRAGVAELVAVAVRPLVVGRPTVVLRGPVGRDAATGEKVATWR